MLDEMMTILDLYVLNNTMSGFETLNCPVVSITQAVCKYCECFQREQVNVFAGADKENIKSE